MPFFFHTMPRLVNHFAYNKPSCLRACEATLESMTDAETDALDKIDAEEMKSAAREGKPPLWAHGAPVLRLYGPLCQARLDV